MKNGLVVLLLAASLATYGQSIKKSRYPETRGSTSLGIMMLFEEGKLLLDDAISIS